MSPGSMSGVHCTRLTVASIDSAKARASIDFPVPGRSSNRTCPSQSMATSARRTTSDLPLITDSTFAVMSSNDRLNSDAVTFGRRVRVPFRAAAISDPFDGEELVLAGTAAHVRDGAVVELEHGGGE